MVDARYTIRLSYSGYSTRVAVTVLMEIFLYGGSWTGRFLNRLYQRLRNAIDWLWQWQPIGVTMRESSTANRSTDRRFLFNVPISRRKLASCRGRRKIMVLSHLDFGDNGHNFRRWNVQWVSIGFNSHNVFCIEIGNSWQVYGILGRWLVHTP
ncbi:hypothetical protein J6590_032279 [Homalodisca vitripennis]|nr:hypothetical protein J6590_032279 [Homalodisca vitripennis]